MKKGAIGLKVHNNTSLAEEEIKSRKVVGVIKNNWRTRIVTLYESEDQTKVYAIGISFDYSTKVITHEEIGMNERLAIDYWKHEKKILVRD